MGRAVAVVLLGCVAWTASAQAQDMWSEQALAVHARASADYGLWVWARHDLALLPMQRRCFDDIATQAGAVVRMLPERVAAGRIRRETVADAARRLSELEERAELQCTVVRRSEGDVDVDMSVDPLARRMRRDRVILRFGARYEGVPRVRRGGYAIVEAGMTRAAIGGFVLEGLRLEVTMGLGWLPIWGPAGALGGRAIVTAPWSIARIGVGVAASVVLAADRLGQFEFSWLGLQFEIPVELVFEISESFGLTMTGGPLFTQAGQLRLSERAISFTAGVLAEVVL